MTDCLKCSYTKGEPKGSRVCKKCHRPENVPKGDARLIGGPRHAIADLAPEVEQARPTVSPVTAMIGAESARPGEPSVPAPPEVGQACPTKDALFATSMRSEPSAETPKTVGTTLPAHSRMGGSAAHRFLNCPGSTALIAGLKLGESDDPDWTRDGTTAHSLAARCLETDADAWELVSQFPLPPDQATAVQEYIDVVRSLSGQRRVEVKLHLPDLHPLMFSTLDVTLDHMVGEFALTVLDYKHGEGVLVSVVDNEQLMYYACMAIMERPQDFDDSDMVRLGICQPRITWVGETTRWRVMSVGNLKAWLYEVLLPAMRLGVQDMHLQMGEWCRFCPAKLVCPAMSQAFDAFAGATNELADLSDEVLGRDYALTATVKMRIRAIEAETFRRRMEGVEVPGSKLVYMKTDRVWKDEAELMARKRFNGEDIYTHPKFLSPAALEKLPEGKAFVSEWAYKPEAGYTVALADDPRPAVVPKIPEEKYGDPSQYIFC